MQAGRAHHSGDDLAIQLNSHQRAEGGNTARKFFRAVDRVDDHARAPGSTRRLRIAAAHFFSKNVQWQSASRHFGPRHLFHGTVCLSHRRAVAFSVNAQFVGAEIPQRNPVRLLRDRFQQRSIFLPVTHAFTRSARNTAVTAICLSSRAPLAYKVIQMSAQANTGTVLDRILEAPRAEVDHRKRVLPETALKYGVKAATPLRDFSAALCRDGLNVVAELKPASPSRGVIRDPFDPVALAQALEAAGASALSVLTEAEFFRGSLKNLRDARKAIQLPVLRKDFIFDPWQVWETRANDADSFLLIVAVLQDALLRDLIALGREMGMEPLVEVHTAHELDRALAAGRRIVGVNNRNLKTLTVSVEASFELIDRIPDDCIAVSESGLRTHDELVKLRAAGFDAFLVGTHLMLSPDPAAALSALLNSPPGTL